MNRSESFVGSVQKMKGEALSIYKNDYLLFYHPVFAVRLLSVVYPSAAWSRISARVASTVRALHRNSVDRCLHINQYQGFQLFEVTWFKSVQSNGSQFVQFVSY